MWTRDYYARYQNDNGWHSYFGHSHFPQERLLSTKAADLWASVNFRCGAIFRIR